MKVIPKYFIALLIVLFESGNQSKGQTNWPLTKSNASVQVALPLEFGTPTVQPLYVDGWEDGIFISRDGLNLYCIYLPADGLSWSIAGGPCAFTPYQKGPTFGMDLATSPTTACPTWLHGDVLISSRTSTLLPFPTWSLSNLSGPIFSEGAPQFSMLNTTTSDIVVFTSNKLPPYNADLYTIRNSGINPSANSGTIMPAPVTQTTTEDNPHIERLSATDLVLFFDSPDRLGGLGGLDLWYATSNDDGNTWNAPQQVSTLNTTQNEHQPHLYKDAQNIWWIYYTTPDISTKYAIFRAQQTTPNNWDSWGPKQLVVGPGNSAGIGEPTLTQNGDLSFVVINQDPNPTSTDKFDADPWILPRLINTTQINENANQLSVSIFPNPTPINFQLKINSSHYKSYTINLRNILGQVLISKSCVNEQVTIERGLIESGVYFIEIYCENQLLQTEKIVFVD